jgi:hypothetical protein
MLCRVLGSIMRLYWLSLGLNVSEMVSSLSAEDIDNG